MTQRGAGKIGRHPIARHARLAWRRTIDRTLTHCDALVLPTLPIVAPKRGEAEVAVGPNRSERVPVRSAMLRHTQLFKCGAIHQLREERNHAIVRAEAEARNRPAGEIAEAHQRGDLGHFLY